MKRLAAAACLLTMTLACGDGDGDSVTGPSRGAPVTTDLDLRGDPGDYIGAESRTATRSPTRSGRRE